MERNKGDRWNSSRLDKRDKSEASVRFEEGYHKRSAKDRAVSPVISVILLVAITAILAAVIGTFVLGLAEETGSSTPQVTFDAETDDSGAVKIYHVTGDTLTPQSMYLSYDGQRISVADIVDRDELVAGDSIELPSAPEGNSIDIIYEGEYDSAILSTVTFPGSNTVLFDQFTEDTSGDYTSVVHNKRNPGEGFMWNPDQNRIESDESNNDLTLDWGTTIDDLDDVGSDNLEVSTRAKSGDDDGVGVFIKAEDDTYYEALITNDYPRDDSGIYSHSSGSSMKNEGESTISDPNNNDLSVYNYHEITLRYDGTTLEMYVDGELKSSYDVDMTPESVGIVSAANSGNKDPNTELSGAVFQYLSVSPADS